MIERTPLLNLATHLILGFGLIIILAPIWLAFVAATLTLQEVNAAPVELWPGTHLWANLKEAWVLSDFGPKFVNSLIVAVGEPPTRIELPSTPAGLSQVLVLVAVLMLAPVIVGLVPPVGKP